MENKTYSHYLGKLLNGFVINNAISGSCNRRIIRSSIHDLLLERKQNPDQKIIALIQLSFETRDELWIDDISSEENDRPAAESNFRTHQFSILSNWRELLLANKLPRHSMNYNTNDKFLKKWSEGRAFFYNSYAERINLLTDILLFTTFLKSQNIDYLIFSGPSMETLQSEHLVDFFKLQLQDPNIFDFEKFGFCNWCNANGFESIDTTEPKGTGHYKQDAHLAFAEQVLLPKLKKLEIIS
jgi:hypothetical protein